MFRTIVSSGALLFAVLVVGLSVRQTRVQASCNSPECVQVKYDLDKGTGYNKYCWLVNYDVATKTMQGSAYSLTYADTGFGTKKDDEVNPKSPGFRIGCDGTTDCKTPGTQVPVSGLVSKITGMMPANVSFSTDCQKKSLVTRICG